VVLLLCTITPGNCKYTKYSMKAILDEGQYAITVLQSIARAILMNRKMAYIAFGVP
jgi:hypothetical protein